MTTGDSRDYPPGIAVPTGHRGTRDKTPLGVIPSRVVTAESDRAPGIDSRLVKR